MKKREANQLDEKNKDTNKNEKEEDTKKDMIKEWLMKRNGTGTESMKKGREPRLTVRRGTLDSESVYERGNENDETVKKQMKKKWGVKK